MLMPSWIGTVCVVGPNIVAAHASGHEGWLLRVELGLTYDQGAFFIEAFETPEEAIERARLIAERFGVMAASEAIDADVMDPYD